MVFLTWLTCNIENMDNIGATGVGIMFVYAEKDHT